jgi:hypothetical protein
LNAPPQILQFKGPVTWEAGPGRAGITLVGTLVGPDGGMTAAQLSLSGVESSQLPPQMHDLTFEALPGQDMVLRSAGREWPLRGTAWQLHRPVGAMFLTVIRPRPTPWARRLAWRVLLGIAAIAPGRWLLARQRRRVK